MIDTAQNFVQALVIVYTALILIHILMSWIGMLFQMPYSIWLNRLRTFLHDTVEPYLGLFRRFIPPLGGFDFSPILAIITLQVVGGVLVRFLDRFN